MSAVAMVGALKRTETSETSASFFLSLTKPQQEQRRLVVGGC